MVKNLAQLKRTLVKGAEFEIVAHARQGCVGQRVQYTREDARRSLWEYRENLQAYGKCDVRMVKRRERLEEIA